MKEIIFSEIKDELIKRIEDVGFDVMGDKQKMNEWGYWLPSPAYKLLDGLIKDERVTRNRARMEDYILSLWSVKIKSLITGQILEFDLKHLMPELFE